MSRAVRGRAQGFSVFTSLIPISACDNWRDESKALRDMFPHAHRIGESSGGGHSDYEVLDGDLIGAHLPSLFSLYINLWPLVRSAVKRTVLLSPWQKSAVNVKLYNEGQGWHYDTNPLTAILYLTGTGAPTLLKTGEDLTAILPSTGRLLVFEGKEIPHCVPDLDEERIVVIMNYYYPSDLSRPDWIDGAVYENQLIAQRTTAAASPSPP